jgi:hypothetical protein
MKTIHWVEEASTEEQRKLIEEEVRAKLKAEMRNSEDAQAEKPRSTPAAKHHVLRSILIAAAVLAAAALVFYAVTVLGKPGETLPGTLEKIQQNPDAAEDTLKRLRPKGEQ